ncbi:GIY-YIG nuclease family protein [Nocardiopsis dassonvillei]|uniref:GIY-YIG nuclease family protein n=1 Tax=Nocardiopsis dassonvillei TaxID=2014 RepID=UPI0020A2A02F|nr:GIY-YIG nuclease family protein [Nocardiopsis dassonvillei]MCP3017276.1 GIY-YIG nuclease family protein [Nocardiopsis dassonvillei]
MSKLALYRFYNDGGQLLYVGITNDPPRRMGQHEAKTWWPQVRGMTVDWYPDRASVLAAEKRAINVENPLHNIQHKPEVKGHRDHAEADDENVVWTPKEVACQVLANLSMEDIDAALESAKKDYGTEGNDEETHVYAAISASHSVWHDREVLIHSLTRMLQSRPDYRKLLFRARTDVANNMGANYTETDLIARAAILAAEQDTRDNDAS